jgi:disulfide bond formation protein DsbB
MAEPKTEQLMLAEMQVLLAQLRTQLSVVRVGMALTSGAVTIFFVLEANNWQLFGLETYNWYFRIALALVALLGVGRFANAERKIVKIHHLIRASEEKNKRIGEIMV